MDIRTGSLTFGRARGSGPRTARTFFNFTSPVRQAVAILAGTNFGFSPRDDHHLGLVNVRLNTSIDDDVVTVEGTFGVRDWSDDWDDDYEGNIQFVLLAELDTGFVPSNLSITGLEFNQTIQFFRSLLDPATAQPDNAIGLIAGKNTIVRVYIDTQTDAARPTIGTISGVLEVRLPGSAAWTPIIPLNAPISPRRDAAINRRNAGDTLNFLIPGFAAAGRLDHRVRAFDALHANQPGYTSGTVQGTLEFTAVEPLRVRGVGIQFTGGGANIAAPTVADLRSTLSFVLKNYPVGEIFITGFDVIDYGGDFTDTSGDGCGSGWGDLLDRLREMQGDSDDVYFGLVPAGVPFANVIGCGGGDGRVAAGGVGDGPTAAQEIAHAFGREHAPCANVGGVDSSYPTYDALPMGSIGEVGMDDTGSVQDPTGTVDFMGSGCAPPFWASPYTYEGLRSKFPAVPTSAQLRARKAQHSAEFRRVATEHLFLSFRIYRGGHVAVFPSFHYPAQPEPRPGKWSPYAVELRDRHNRALHAQRIWLTDPHKTLDSAALDFYKPVPFHKDAARVVFTCDVPGECESRELLSVDIPQDAPTVRLVAPKEFGRLSGKVRVAWEGHLEGKPLHYLLRYSNDGGRVWRAITPRLQAAEYVVDLDRLPGGDDCRFQILATEGIRTGMVVSERFHAPQRPRETSIIAPASGTVVRPGEPVTLTGESFSPHTGSALASELHWSSDLEGSLGTGHELHVRTLRPGTHTISLRAPDGCGDESVASTQIEVRIPRPLKHTSLTHPDHTSKDHDSGKIPPERKTPPGRKGGPQRGD